jgi:hypothetical protein
MGSKKNLKNYKKKSAKKVVPKGKKKKVKYVVKGRVKEEETEEKKEKTVEDKFYWSKALTGIIAAIFGSAVFKLIGWWMLAYLLVFLLVFPFFLSFVIFKLKYIKDQWDWKKILKTGLAAFFFLFMLVSTAIHTINTFDNYKSQFDNPADTHDVYMHNNTAFIADGSNGLLCVDITAPAHRILLGSYQTSGSAKSVIFENNITYIHHGSFSIDIVNVSNPSNPVKLSTLSTNETISKFYVANNSIYVAQNNLGLQVFNSSNKIEPVWRGTFKNGTISDLVVDGDIIYMLDSNLGLTLINKNNLQLISNYTINGSIFQSLDFQNKTVFVADRQLGIHILDVSNPNNIANISRYKSAGDFPDVKAVNDMLYLAAGNDGLLGINISNLQKPTYDFLYNTVGYSSNIDTFNNYVMIADGSRGLIEYYIPNPAAEPIAAATSGTISFGWTWVGFSAITIMIIFITIKKRTKSLHK